MSLRPRYSRAFKLDPPGTELTHIEGRGHRHHDGAAEAPHGAQEPAGGGAPLPPKADQRQEEVGPECATTHPGPSQPSAHPRPSGEPSGLRPGNGTEVQKGGGRKTHLLYITFREGRLSIFQCNDASNQTIKTIGIDMQLQDLAFESPIWQDPLYVLKARSLHPLDTPKTLTVHHDINRRM